MISLSAMSSSEVSGLKENLERGAVRREFLKAVERFLRAHPLDGGADSDTVYMVGESLASENVWELISPKMVAQFVGAAYRPSLEVFLEAVPEYLQKVLKELDASEASASALSSSGSVIWTELVEPGHPIEPLAHPLISHYARIQADLNQVRAAYYASVRPTRGPMLRSASQLGIAITMDKPGQVVVVKKPEIKGTIILTGSEPHYVTAAKKKPRLHSNKHK